MQFNTKLNAQCRRVELVFSICFDKTIFIYCTSFKLQQFITYGIWSSVFCRYLSKYISFNFFPIHLYFYLFSFDKILETCWVFIKKSFNESGSLQHIFYTYIIFWSSGNIVKLIELCFKKWRYGLITHISKVTQFQNNGKDDCT